MDKTNQEEKKCYFEVKGIQQQYPGIHALKGIDLKINKNDIIGFAGENGAGKSTLLRIISGVENPISGELFKDGVKYSPQSFREANMLGVSMVFQEQNLIPDLTVYENLFLSHEEKFTKKGILDKRMMIKKANMYLKNFDMDIDARKEVMNYTFHERQMLEIIRAFVVADLYNIDTPLILLDEPTAGLPEKNANCCFRRFRHSQERQHSSSFLIVCQN